MAERAAGQSRPLTSAPGPVGTPGGHGAAAPPVASFWARMVAWLPRGGLPPDAWNVRHRVILWILLLHIPPLTLLGLYDGFDPWISRAYFRGYGVTTSLIEGGVLLLFFTIAAWPRLSRRIRAVAASVGLVTCSAVLTQFSGGFIEAHFHFFVMLGVIAMYLDWIPFLLAIGYVAVHHGTVGTFFPGAVYNHPAAVAAPWNWAFIHAFFVMALSVALISHWRAAEDALARTDSVLQVAQEPVLGLDPQGRVAFANPAAAQLLSMPVDEVLQQRLLDLVPLPAGDSPLSTLADKAPRRGTHSEVRLPDGSARPIEWSSAPVGDGRGGLGAVVTLRDLTDQHRQEAERLHQRETLHELQQLREQDAFKSRFINTAAHELNTPLTPVNIQMRMLMKDTEGLDEHQKEALDILHRNVLRFGRLVQDLLDAARFQGDRLGMRMARTSLDAIAREAVETFDQAAKEKGLTLEARLGTDVEVHADAPRLSQVLYNLLNNALKFTPAGGRIRVTAGQERGSAFVQIEDTGLGLDEGQLKKLFQPFSQVHHQKETMQGSGLGLYLSRAIVELHGGRLGCTSQGPGKGATFRMELPIAEDTPPDPVRSASTAPADQDPDEGHGQKDAAGFPAPS